MRLGLFLLSAPSIVYPLIASFNIGGRHVNDWSDEQTDDPLYADDRNFYKVEKWTKDGTKVDRMLDARNKGEKARDVYAEAIKHRTRIRLKMRQRTRMLQQ